MNPLELTDDSFTGQVPLFPLPGCVLLPGGLLPLHVFEDRYREMVRDSLRAERLIGMALLKPGYEEEYQGSPAIEDHICIGRIVLEQELADGRYNMVLAGLRRAVVEGEDRSRSYRVAQARLLPDPLLPEEVQREEALDLTRFVEGLPAALIRQGSRLGAAMELLASVPASAQLGAGLDLVADAFELAVPERQLLLRTPDVVSRLAVFKRVMRRREQETLNMPLPRDAWPPGFSAN